MSLRRPNLVVLFGLAVCLAASAFAQSRPAAPSVAESNKETVRAFFEEVVNKKNVAHVDEFLAAGFVEHQVAPGLTPDREGAKKFFAMYVAAFPDLKVTVDTILAEGDLVAVAATWTGTHKGEFLGTPATGKAMKVTGIDIIRLKDGKAVEHWGSTDDLGMMQQLGIVKMEH